MRKLFTRAFITAAAASLSNLIFSTPAGSQEANSACEAAAMSARARIEEGRDITVMIEVTDNREAYPDHPSGRPLFVLIVVDGNAADSVMQSPVFQKATASEVIKSCNSVGAVTFGRYETDWSSTIGLMLDGSIQYFECADPSFDGRVELSWGKEWCDI